MCQGFSQVFRCFASFFVMAKLSNSSMRVNLSKTLLSEKVRCEHELSSDVMRYFVTCYYLLLSGQCQQDRSIMGQ